MPDDGAFQRCCDYVIGLEGGDALVVDTDGMTRFGICSRFHPDTDIRNLTRAGAEAIYRREYWTPAGCDGYQWPMNLVVFDTAVNQGTTFARLIGTTAGDYVEALLLRIERYCDIVRKTPGRMVYFHGWVNRVMSIYAHVNGEWQLREKG